jgi:hypothetical protein
VTQKFDDRLQELERILVGKGFKRGTTAQAKAIAFIIEHQETLQDIIAERKGPEPSGGLMPNFQKNEK